MTEIAITFAAGLVTGYWIRREIARRRHNRRMAMIAATYRRLHPRQAE